MYVPYTDRTYFRTSTRKTENKNALGHRGLLVVASYHNHHDDRPGHIAIVRPGSKTAEQIAAEGPDVIQAGSVNKMQPNAIAAFNRALPGELVSGPLPGKKPVRSARGGR
jgi:hypothetical protein